MNVNLSSNDSDWLTNTNLSNNQMYIPYIANCLKSINNSWKEAASGEICLSHVSIALFGNAANNHCKRPAFFSGFRIFFLWFHEWQFQRGKIAPFRCIERTMAEIQTFYTQKNKQTIKK